MGFLLSPSSAPSRVFGVKGSAGFRRRGCVSHVEWLVGWLVVGGCVVCIWRPLISCQIIRSIGSVGASAYAHPIYTHSEHTQARELKPTSDLLARHSGYSCTHPILSLSLSLTHTHTHTPFPIPNCLSAPSLPASMPGPSDYGAPRVQTPNPQKFNLSKVPSSIELAMILGGA